MADATITKPNDGEDPVMRCSACGSTAPHHLAYVRETGKCVV